MNIDTLNALNPEGVNKIIDELISHFHLSAEQLSDITKVMQARGVSFAEAAINLQLVTANQLDDIAAKASRMLDNKSGVIETALRKVARRTPLTAPLKPSEICEPSSRLTIAHDPYSKRSEKLRGLRTELSLRLGTTSKAAMVAIVSPGHGEGRTQLAAELAIAFAQLDRNTLLVDADLRSPSLFKLFQCNNHRGLSQAIAEGSQPYIVGVKDLPRIHVLNSGPTPSNPIELLSTKRFEQLVASWSDAYDFVILDTPPVAAYADALTITTLVKRVLLVARSNTTRFKDAKEMLRRLSITRSEILGSVVNHF